MQRIFIAGCGDIGKRIARLIQARSEAEIEALARTERAAQTLRGLGLATLVGDLDAGLQTSPDVHHATVFYLVPPPPRGDDDSRVEAFLARLDPLAPPSRVVYVSTTGVYGDCQGRWITESQPLNPQTDRARRRQAAERRMLAWGEKHHVPVVILRVAGIYGPGRLPLERLRQHTPTVHPDQSGASNRIHADDLAAVCLAAATRGRAGAAYNISDGNPSSMTDYLDQVADLVGLERPPRIGLEAAKRQLPAGLMSFLLESKRIDNRLMLTELGVSLRYPSLEEGLPACIEG